MARVNTDILGISELERTGMGEFSSDDHYIYFWGWNAPNQLWNSKGNGMAGAKSEGDDGEN